MKQMTKRKTKSQSKKWFMKTATASAIVDAIADDLDHEEKLDPATLTLIAEAMAKRFEFTDKEEKEFIQAALREQGGHAGDADEEGGRGND
jgi:hypothetical protein